MLELNERIILNELFTTYEGIMKPNKVQILTLYLEEDYSLTEIAEILSISKQAVQRLIKTSISELYFYEEKLKLNEIKKLVPKEKNNGIW